MAITKIQSGAFPADVITSSAIDDLSVTHAKLHTTMDLSSKTVTLPTLSTLNTTGNVGIGTSSSVTNSTLNVNGGINITTGIIGYATNDSFTLNGRTQPHYGCNFTGSSGNPSGISGYYGISFAADGAEKMRMESSGNVGINNSNPSQRLNVNSPGGAGANAAGKYSEVMAQIHETGGQTESGRRGIMFFNDINNWYNGTEKTVFGMAFNNNGAIRGGLQYDHKNTERMTMWSGYGPIEFKVPSATASGDYRADQAQLTPLTIKSVTGNIGIGTTSPNTQLEISSPYNTTLRLSATRNSNAWAVGDSVARIEMYSEDGTWPTASVRSSIDAVVENTSGNGVGLAFKTLNNAERMRITNDGKVGIGTTAPMSHLHVNKDVTGSNTDGITLGKVEANGWIDTNEEMGRLGWAASYGSSYTPAIGAYISAKADANWNGNEAPTRLGFFTAPENSLTPVERLRITKDGVVSMPYQCNVSAYPSATTVTISQNSTWQILQFNSTRWDNNNDYNTSNSRFTAPVTGKYLFGINLQLENANGITWSYIVPLVNGNAAGTSGNTMADFTPPNGTYFNHAATWMLTLSANDYVELQAIGSGGSYSLKGNTESSYYISLMA